ncbi:ATP-grasp domain-containing protein [Fusobacterium necrophorum subsp. funduliforme]
MKFQNREVINFIFCNHPLSNKTVDPDYEKEYALALRLGFNVALFSYEELELGNLKLFQPPEKEIKGFTIYRGWMMKPELYKNFYQKLSEREIFLVNSPEEYNYCHLLPKWYDEVFPETPKSYWTTDNSIEEAVKILKEVKKDAIIKDYVKSRKHEWKDSFFIPFHQNMEYKRKIIENFIHRQGEGLIGGIVFREFISLKSLGLHQKSAIPISEEYRIVILLGKIISISSYWIRKEKINKEKIENFVTKYIHKIKSNFFTIDLGVLENGELIIIELGDGQVSGLQEEKVENYYRNIDYLLTKKILVKK